MKIMLFGIVKDIVKADTLDFAYKNDMQISDLQNELLLKYPSLKDIKKFAFAVNEEYVDENTILNENDVVAIIPPVSGG